MPKPTFRLSLILSTALIACTPLGVAYAQETETVTLTGPQEGPASSAPAERVTVVGSQIAGAETTGAVPVTVVGTDAIEATGAVSAEELFRTIPQAGDITFNGTYLGGANSNAARGDISTVSLRGLAQGNTLALLNGRRMVVHPTSQTDNSTPVFGYNVNAIPVAGLARVEVLKEGAAALYGSDAVAGVVNNVLQKDFVGLDVSLQYGLAEGTNLEEWTGDILYGTDFADGRGNISLFLGGTKRTEMLASDQDYTATADLRGLVDDPDFANAAGFDNRSLFATPWGVFTPIPDQQAQYSVNGTPFTNASGQFHIQPTTGFPGCVIPDGDICVGAGDISGSAYRDLRTDIPAANADFTILPAVDRINAFTFVNYDISNSLSFFGEFGYYWAETEAVSSPSASLGSAPITVAADAYWNPLGPVGSPNRIPGIDAPAEGVALTINRLAVMDAGYRDIWVENKQLRLLAGLSGNFMGWDWESAVLYNEANVADNQDIGNSTLYQQAINRTDPTAYNPFNGGDPMNPGLADISLNPPEAIDFMTVATRENNAKLTLADFKISRPDLFSIWAGNVGIAGGVEVRKHEYMDDRDELQDESTPYIDEVTGLFSGSSLMGHSPSPDVEGEREVYSAYVELAVPLVSPDMDIPLVQQIEIQLAGRYEDYSDIGSVSKPKIAGFWDVSDSLRLRGSWSEGFKAPNLEVVNVRSLERLNTRTDYYQCQADINAGRISDIGACIRAYGVPGLRQGNQDLVPEESTSYNYGAVFEPMFLPPEMGSLIFTIDKWNIEQTGIVGVLSEQTAIGLDYLYRLRGESNPLVVRVDPTPQQIANFAGTGLAPVGDVLYVDSVFQNLQPLEVGGLDFGILWDLPVGPGDLNMNFNASKLEKYFQQPSPFEQELITAIESGEIETIPVAGAASLLEQNGRPEWKASVSLTYSVGEWQFGAFTEYTGPVEQTSVQAGGEFWEIEESYRMNLYGEYNFPGETRVRLGVRNVFNEDPPLADGGYLSSLYQPLPRYWYASVKKSF